jgi:AraC-like DNA-binding protein
MNQLTRTFGKKNVGQLILRNVFETPEFGVMLRNAGKGFHMGPHAHIEHRISFVVHGAHKCRLPTSSVRLNAGDCGFLNPYELHEDLQTCQGYEYLTVILRAEFFTRTLGEKESSLRFPVPKLARDAFLGSLCGAIHEELTGNRSCRNAMIRSLVTRLAVEVTRKFSFKSYNMNSFSRPLMPDVRVAKAIDYLKENYKDHFNLHVLCRTVGLSASQLERRFHRALGLTPRTFLAMLRVEDAKRQLVSSPVPLCQIAYDLGFVDQAHLCRVFKKFASLTPKVFRESMSAIQPRP